MSPLVPSSRLFFWVPPGLRRGGRRLASSKRQHAETSVCREGWYYLLIVTFVFTGAMLREVNLMLILAGMLFGPLLLNRWLMAATLKGLEIQRRIPHGICAGDLLVVNVELTNTRRRLGSWAITVEEEIHRQRDGAAIEPIRLQTFFPYVAAGTSVTGGYRGRLPQRGQYRFAAVQVSSRFPFGLFRRTVTMGPPRMLFVFPRLGRLTQRWIKRRRESFEGTHRRERRHSRVSGNFYGVREWRHGDSSRWIHWRSTARHGTLVVRQFEQHRNRDVAVLVELWQPEEPSPADLENVELAISFAATVIADLCRKVDCNLLLGTTTPEPGCVSGSASAVLLQDAMTRLAVAEAESEDRLPELFQAVARRIRPGTEVVLVSTRNVDLSDTGRFPALWDDTASAALARRIQLITTNSGDLDRYFRAD